MGPVASECGFCRGQRSHKVVHKLREQDDENYQAATTYYILKCHGCGYVSFRRDYEDYEAGSYDYNNEWDFPTTTQIFPKYVDSAISDYARAYIPKMVRKVYLETLTAIQEESRILAGLGLRGTVEAICIDRNVKAKDLAQRIEKLASAGYISKKDLERLHGIRFLGNDAAHDIKEPTRDQICVALKIVEHAISSIYVLEKEAAGEIETSISDFGQFKELLQRELADGKFKSGQELSLKGFLGDKFRRVQEYLMEFENDLIAQIASGKFKALSLGNTQQVGSPPKPLQLFRIA